MQTALSQLANTDFREAALEFFRVFGYASPRTFDYLALSFAEFCEALDVEIKSERVLASDWKAVHLLFQFTEEEVKQQTTTFGAAARELFNTFVFVALELNGQSYSRTDLANIARESTSRSLLL